MRLFLVVFYHLYFCTVNLLLCWVDQISQHGVRTLHCICCCYFALLDEEILFLWTPCITVGFFHGFRTHFKVLEGTCPTILFETYSECCCIQENRVVIVLLLRMYRFMYQFIYVAPRCCACVLSHKFCSASTIMIVIGRFV